LDKGKHPNIHLQRAWTSYGSDVFRFRVLAILEKDELIPTEQRYLDRFHSRERLYNLAVDAVAPMKGRLFSDESKQKIRKRLSDPRVREEIADTVKSTWANPEMRQKYVDAARKRYSCPKERKKMSDMKKALHADPERRKHLAECAKRNWADPEKRKIMAAINIGRKASPETRSKMSVSQRARRDREASV
jgi:group I intron endonuclease